MIIEAERCAAFRQRASPPVRLSRQPAARLLRLPTPWEESWTLPDLLSLSECSGLVAALESTSCFAAHAGGQTTRISDVIVWVAPRSFTDRISQRLEDAGLFAAVRKSAHAPASLASRGINARCRCYRYSVGHRFKPHYDASQYATVLHDSKVTPHLAPCRRRRIHTRASSLAHLG